MTSTNPLQTDDQHKVDALIELWRGTGARITERRSYEWKIAFGVWGAQLIAMGVLLAHVTPTNKSSLHDWWFFAIYLGGGAVVALLHTFYTVGFVRTNMRKDTRLAISYERAIGCLLKTKLEVPVEMVKEKAELSSVHLFSFGMTWFLAILGPVAIHAAT
jgi:hypothetical protein